ncbi:uncharacterized protein K02A2.6-like isoform X2 [Wyeomyia smithii]|nr:uncharacterized protein K02A2.6-like isoform X2 [Wyeomyia smithii]
MVRSATKKDKLLQTVIQHINTGWPADKQITDPSLNTFCCWRESLSIIKDYIMFCDRIVVPAVYRGRILKQVHRGHPGMDRMKSKAEGPWKRIHLDYAGPIEEMYYLVIVDSFTKWPEIFQSASSTAPLTIGLLRETFARFGKPDALVTDNGSQFCSGILKQFCEKSVIIHISTAPYHSQSNGQAERFVDTLNRSLRKITDVENIPSSEALQTFLQVYRSTLSNVLEGKSPAEVMFGRPMTITLDLLRPTGINQAQSTSTLLSPSATTLTAGAMVYAKVHKNAKT